MSKTAEVERLGLMESANSDEGCRSCSCICSHQGCISRIVNRTELDSSGNIKRVNMKVSTCILCQSGLNRSGLDPSDTQRLPPELSNKQISLADWQHWVDLLAIAQANTGWSAFYLCCIIPKAFVSILTFPRAWKKQKESVLLRDKLLREFQKEANRTLEPLGMFIKTRSYLLVTSNMDGNRNRHVTYWLAIAMNEEEVEVLKKEPHLTGMIDTDEWCFGVNESELCWHHS